MRWIVVGAMALALAGCEDVQLGAGSTTFARGDALRGRVVKVTDGDTIRVRLADGRRVEKVRYIGIDTPEVFGSAECFGRESSAANRRLVGGRDVRLTLDVEERDRYGRLLAYVRAGGVFVNERLVRDGFATQLTVPPNVAHAERFRRAARRAREEGRGLWSAC